MYHSEKSTQSKSVTSGGYVCQHCGKKHTRKTSHDRHILLCEIVYCSKREKKCEAEETSDLPSYLQLCQIVQELAIKNSVLEEKMSEMQKWLDKKKKNIDVVQWLTTNRANLGEPFCDWQKKLIVTSDHIDLLIEENIVRAICEVISENTNNIQDAPITCFQQKANLFYIFYKDCDQQGWRKATPDDFILFVKHIHKKLWVQLSEWKERNAEKMKNSDKLCDLYSRTIIKLSGLNFDQDSVQMSKIRTHLYYHLKMDLKNIVEYDFCNI